MPKWARQLTSLLIFISRPRFSQVWLLYPFSHPFEQSFILFFHSSFFRSPPHKSNTSLKQRFSRVKLHMRWINRHTKESSFADVSDAPALPTYAVFAHESVCQPAFFAIHPSRLLPVSPVFDECRDDFSMPHFPFSKPIRNHTHIHTHTHTRTHTRAHTQTHRLVAVVVCKSELSLLDN